MSQRYSIDGKTWDTPRRVERDKWGYPFACWLSCGFIAGASDPHRAREIADLHQSGQHQPPKYPPTIDARTKAELDEDFDVGCRLYDGWSPQ